jgi:hypothetical protein
MKPTTDPEPQDLCAWDVAGPLEGKDPLANWSLCQARGATAKPALSESSEAGFLVFKERPKCTAFVIELALESPPSPPRGRPVTGAAWPSPSARWWGGIRPAPAAMKDLSGIPSGET